MACWRGITLSVQVFSISLTYNLGILGIIFILVGHFVKRSLRLWNEDLEEVARPRINFSISVLWIPLFVRTLYNLIWQVTDFDDEMNRSIKDDTLLAPLITFFFILTADFVPITSQLVSMLVIIDENDKQRGTMFQSGIHEDSEYIETLVHNISDKGSFLSDQDGSDRRFIINGSREFAPGLGFKTQSLDNLEGTGANVGSNEDNEDSIED